MFDALSIAIINNVIRACHDLLADPAPEVFESWPLIVAGGGPLDEDRRRILCRDAVASGSAILYLAFGDRVQRGPQGIEIITPSAGVCQVYTDCVVCPSAPNGLSLRRRSSPAGRFAIRRGDLVHISDAAPMLSVPELERSARLLRCHAGKMELGLEWHGFVAVSDRPRDRRRNQQSAIVVN
jgi:hypothetical protein